ncbi:MAG: hypothetical protein NTX61_05580 [Bacteroidetes bacterium]|nr:hypothetical protein [Bacteroidota bacterium]
MIDIKYDILFSVELLHQYFRNQLCQDFTLIPSAATRRTLAGHKIIAKQYHNRLITGVELDKSGNLPVVPEEGLNFTFFLKLNNSLFLNYTNLPVPPSNGMIYYFSNRNNNTFGGSYLTEDINPYDSNDFYHPGSLVASPSGDVYQAWRKSDLTNPHSYTDPDYWVRIGNIPCGSENEAVRWLPSIMQYSFPSPQSSVTILVKGYAAGTRMFTEIVLSKTIMFPKPVNSFKLDLTSLPAGKYILKIDGGKEAPVYLNDELYGQNVFGVIDLYCESTLPPGYMMLNPSHHLLSPVYKILFPNRFLLWKYVLQHSSGGTLEDTDKVFQFAADPSGTAATIISKTPIPLSEDPVKTLKLKVDTNEYTSIPNASPDRLSLYPFHRGLYDEEPLTCFEINLNY